MRTALDLLNGAQSALSRLGAFLSGAALLAVTGMLLVDVTGRAFGRPLFGAQDMAEMAMVAITFGVLAQLDRQDGQIRVDLLRGAMSPCHLAIVARASALIAMLVWATLAWTLCDAARLSAMLSLSTNIMGIPKAPFQYLLAGFALIAALGAALRVLSGPEEQR